MSTQFLQDGDVIQHTNGGVATIPANSIVAIGNLIGVALVDIAVGATGSVALEGVFSGVPKVASAVFAKGEKLIWDSSAGKFDDSAATPASGDITGGAVAWVAGANTETTCTIKITPGNSTLTA